MSCTISQAGDCSGTASLSWQAVVTPQGAQGPSESFPHLTGKKIVAGSLRCFLTWFSFSFFVLFVCFLIFPVLKLDSLCLHGMTQIYSASKSRWRKKDPKTGEHKRHKSYIFYRCEIYSGLSYFKNVHVLLFNKCNQKDKWWFSLAAIKVCTVVVTHLQNGVVFGHFSENMSTVTPLSFSSYEHLLEESCPDSCHNVIMCCYM